VKRRVAATVGSSERTILVTTHPFTTMRRRAVTTVHSSERAILVTTHPLTTMRRCVRGDRSLFGADDPRHDPSPHHDEETRHRDRSLFGVSDHDGPSPHRATR